MDLLRARHRLRRSPGRRTKAWRFLLAALGATGALAVAFSLAWADTPLLVDDVVQHREDLKGSVPPALLRIAPARQDSLLVCILETVGLPDSRSAETLLSGLPSSLTIVLSLLDGRGKERTHVESEIRMVPDPLEGHITIEAPFGMRRTPSLAGLSEILRALGPLPVAALREVPNTPGTTLRARVAIHPLAPSASERVQGMVGEEENGSRREFSIGIGSLLRYFLGQRPGEHWDLEKRSSPFRRDELQELKTDS